MLIAAAVAAVSAALISPTYLRCEMQSDPVGIGTPTPRFSWLLEARDRKKHDLRQTHYRILVASSTRALAADRGDLWDSGKVSSSDTFGIRYAGAPLVSNQLCFWKVRVTDQEGNDSEWSRTARFSVGLLQQSDWKAQWIGFDAPLIALPLDVFEGATWIWTDGRPVFEKKFDAIAGLASARIRVTVDDQFVLYLNGAEIARSDGSTDAWRKPALIDVTKLLKPGENAIRLEGVNTGGIGAALFGLEMYDGGGARTVVQSDTTWMVPGSTVNAVAKYGDGPWGRISDGKLVLPAPRELRHKFDVSKKVRRATLYGSALGLIDMQINDKPVSKDLFAPGWTDYNKRVYAMAYDVTRMMKGGANEIGCTIGDGWYAGYVGYGHMREHYGRSPRALMQLEIEFEDGTRESIASSADWQASVGPILESDFLMGELYDARLAGSDRAWSPVVVGSPLSPVIEMFPGDPVREFEALKPKSVKESQPGVYILDLGQNIAGFARLKVRGDAGQKITLRFAERLNRDGSFYTDNLRGARAIDTYICRGGGVETWQPSFTFHGFQYIEVSGLKSAPKGDEIIGIAISSETPLAGKIETSDAMINQLVSNAWWTQKMNFIDIPTDCPQRDERLGWTGDAQAYIRTACMLDDVHAFFTKWLVSLDDAQRADGQFPMVAPLKVADGDGGPAWADAGVICPWTIYDVYGDLELLARHYGPMKKFVDFYVARGTDLMPPKQFHCFGDWLNINDPTPSEVIYMAYFAGSALLVSQSAAALGNTADASHYKQLYSAVREKFQEHFVAEDGSVGYGNIKRSQCGSILALAFDLVSGDMRKKVANVLIEQIESRGWHLSTGFVGTRDIMNVLSKVGRNDVAFRLLHNKTFPSWGFTIENGATSIWERWDGWTPEKGFQDPGMNSFAHYAFGAVVGWIFAQPAGIKNADPGFRSIVLAPQIDPNLKWLKSQYDSISGRIESEWKVNRDRIEYRFVVPPNVRAEIRLPAQLVGSSKKLLNIGSEIEPIFNVGSGEYRFVSAIPTNG